MALKLNVPEIVDAMARTFNRTIMALKRRISHLRYKLLPLLIVPLWH